MRTRQLHSESSCAVLRTVHFLPLSLLSPLRHIKREKLLSAAVSLFFASVIYSGFKRSVSPRCISLTIGDSGEKCRGRIEACASIPALTSTAAVNIRRQTKRQNNRCSLRTIASTYRDKLSSRYREYPYANKAGKFYSVFLKLYPFKEAMAKKKASFRTPDTCSEPSAPALHAVAAVLARLSHFAEEARQILIKGACKRQIVRGVVRAEHGSRRVDMR